MDALSIKQPFAGLIMSKKKKSEYRSWKPPERMIGKRFVIHASSRPDPRSASTYARMRANDLPPEEFFPNSMLLGTAILVRTRLNKKTGIYAWVLKDPVPFKKPIPWPKGRLGIWQVDDKIVTG